MIKKIFIPILVLLAFSCSLSNNTKKLEGTLTLSIDRNNSRTVLPDTDSINIIEYVVTFSNGPEEISIDPIPANTFTGSKTINNIPVFDKWTINVEAFIENKKSEGGKLLASQTKTNVNIEAKPDNKESFTLKLMQENQGNVDITLDWSDAELSAENTLNKMIEKNLFKIKPDGTQEAVTGWEDDLILSKDDKKLTFNSTLNSGFYLLKVILGKDNEKIIPYVRMIHIYDNLLSIDEFGTDIHGKNVVKLTKDDFNPQPDAPTSLTATEGKKSVILNWQPGTNNVLYYVVERKEGTEPWKVIAPKVEGTETYTDKEDGAHKVVDGTIYKYRVKAVGLSQFESSYTNEQEGFWQSPKPGDGGKLQLDGIAKTKEFTISFAEALSPDNNIKTHYQIVVSDTATDVMGTDENINNLKDNWVTYSSIDKVISGLTHNTDYYLNVFVRDEKGNIAPYIDELNEEEFKKKFKDGSGKHIFKTNNVADVELSISLEIINNVTITSNLSSIVTHNINDDLLLKINEDLNVTSWYLNGTEIATTKEHTITGGTGLNLGINWITVKVEVGSKPYSKNFKIKVVN